jgi:hypothetical protein
VQGAIEIKEDSTMSRRAMQLAITALALVALLIPAAARANNGNKNKSTASATMDLLNPATLGGKQLKPGTYEVKADENKLTVMKDGKTVAEAPLQWKDETGKSQYSAIITDGDGKAIKEVHFIGKTRFVAISESTTANGQQ